MTTHSFGFHLRKQRVPVFHSKLYCYPKYRFSLSFFFLHAFHTLNSYHLPTFWSLYNYLEAPPSYQNLYFPNIDKSREIKSTEASMSTSPVLSDLLICLFVCLFGINSWILNYANWNYKNKFTKRKHKNNKSRHVINNRMLLLGKTPKKTTESSRRIKVCIFFNKA